MALVRRLLLAAVFAAAAPAAFAQQEDPDFEKEYKKQLEQQAKLLKEMAKSATHEVVAEVKVVGTDKKTTLQTLALGADGNVLALVAPPRPYGEPIKNGFGEIHVYDPAGKPVSHWKVGFHAHSLNVGPDGTVYVAGDGKIQAFDAAGKAKAEAAELPHITEMFKDKDALRARAEEALKVEKKQYAEMIAGAQKQFKERIEAIEKKKEEDRTKTDKRQLEQAKSILKSYETMEKDQANKTVDDVLKQMAGRVRVVNGVAVSDRDVFVACGETKGYGYGVWRLSPDLKKADKVLEAIGGCCGQMDIQVAGQDLVVAENTKHQFAKYTRDGKKVGGFGKRGTDDPKCFGGCCNPMNVRCPVSGGDVYTAESEGVIKKFDPKGEFVGVAGAVQIQGGCKNVAIGVSPDGEKLYFCDQPGSKIFVLAKKAEKPAKDGK